jgi:WbqC-like protein family
MKVAIHQPHFLPWLGYLHRMAQVDVFVLLDHVQFERRNYQNRTMIRMNGEARWLTVPVVQRSRDERIVDKEVDNRLDGAKWWAPNHYLTLRHAYRDAAFFGDYAAGFKRLFETRWEKLVELNQAGLDLLREAFGIRTRLMRSSQLAVQGARAELILNICRAVGASTLIAGMGGSRGYLDADAFARAGVRIEHHNWMHPEYPQAGEGSFIPGLSAIDLLFNCGPQSRELLFADRLVAKAA